MACLDLRDVNALVASDLSWDLGGSKQRQHNNHKQGRKNLPQ
jgi:hypothetical protein